MNDIQAETVAEHVHNLLGFVQTQQTVIHEDAGQIFADGAVQQHGGHGRIHAAGEAEDHFIVANLLTNALNSIVDNFAGVHSASHWQISRTKRSSMRRP